MKAVFLDYGTMGADDLDLSALERVAPKLEVYDSTSAHQRRDRVRDAEIVFCNKVGLDEETLAAAGVLRYIGLAATGTDNVDLQYASTRGIAVSNLVAYCTPSVVEHVFALTLALVRNLCTYRDAVTEGRWAKANQFCLLDYPIRQLAGATLGVVGYGELGQAVARAAQQFGMNVMIARRSGQSATQADGRFSLDEVIACSDVLTLHCPLTSETRELINEDTLVQMKPTAMLINTARGALIDAVALRNALTNGIIAGAGIDVLDDEPPIHGNPLLDYSGHNLIVTPHIAWASRDARQNAINELAKNLQAFIDGEHRNRVV